VDTKGVGDIMREEPTMDIDGKLKLSKRLNVGLEIFELTKKEERIYFNKLVEICDRKGIASRATVSKALDPLFDRGLLHSEMVKVDGRWTKQLELTGEGTKFFTKIRKSLEKQGILGKI